jgi:hypothetical protein
MKTPEETRAKWSERVDAWRASGLSAAAFAREQGYPYKTLLWWSSQLRRSAEVQPALLRLVPKTASVPEVSSLIVEIEGAKIHVVPGVDVALFTTVVQALRGQTR